MGDATRSAEVTHYLPLPAQSNSRATQVAMCGEWVEPRLHSSDPTCKKCREELERDYQAMRGMDDG